MLLMLIEKKKKREIMVQKLKAVFDKRIMKVAMVRKGTNLTKMFC